MHALVARHPPLNRHVVAFLGGGPGWIVDDAGRQNRVGAAGGIGGQKMSGSLVGPLAQLPSCAQSWSSRVGTFARLPDSVGAQ
jgi:hypothetical protein